jgi:hypothetical protein
LWMARSNYGKPFLRVNRYIWCRSPFWRQNVVANVCIEAQDFQSVRRLIPYIW